MSTASPPRGSGSSGAVCRRCGRTWRSTTAPPRPPRTRRRHDHHDRRARARRPHDHRPAGEVIALILAADLPERVAADAAAVYRKLASRRGGDPRDRPERRRTPRGRSARLDRRRGRRVRGARVARDRPTSAGAADRRRARLGSQCARHVSPNPAPAVSRLLAEAGATTVGLDTTMEVSTPTGVALLTRARRCLRPDAIAPPCRRPGSGPERPTRPSGPNVVQAIIGVEATAGGAAQPDGGRPVAPARGERRRRHRGGAGPHHRPAARGGSTRRVGDADRDEEGPPGAHRAARCATTPSSGTCARC